jgi:aminopeptidase N
MPERWSDVWLNEGHATWYEFEYAQERGDPEFYLGAAAGKSATRRSAGSSGAGSSDTAARRRAPPTSSHLRPESRTET